MRRFCLFLVMLMLHLAMFAQRGFVKVENGRLMRDGKPYCFVGTNMWYAAILGSEGQGGNRERLCQELDYLKKIGIENLRILVGSDGEDGTAYKAEPTLQKAPGVYNDTILAGLDYLMMELGKRDMMAVLYLNNSWEWSGGYGFYLEQAGCGKSPLPNVDGYDAYVDYVQQFATNEKAHKLFFDYVKFIVSRTNRYTGKRYSDDTSLMSWQIGNEPRAFSKALLLPFERWLSEASALIRSIDANHLISVGSEGAVGSSGDYASFERICRDKNIDYCNIHIWPTNWGWARKTALRADFEKSCDSTRVYIDRHVEICKRINKPLVLEEFGWPRDDQSFSTKASTKLRNQYYDFVFTIVRDHVKKSSPLVGCNFWAWSGFAKPKHEQWQRGDDYAGDPPQEPQGLFSVFVSDKKTVKKIKKFANNVQH